MLKKLFQQLFSSPDSAVVNGHERPLANRHVVADLLTVAEVDDAAAAVAAGALFQRLFKATIPDFPRHFIVRYRFGDKPVVGYVHHTPDHDVYLCGGMCIDAQAYRKMPREHRDRIGAAGGITEIMLRETFAILNDRDAVFGYCGDTKAMRVDLRAGFETTHYPFIIAKWNSGVSEARKLELVEAIYKIGLF